MAAAFVFPTLSAATNVFSDGGQPRVALNGNHHNRLEILEALLVLGPIVHHLVHLAHVVEENHNESEAAGGSIILDCETPVCLQP